MLKDISLKLYWYKNWIIILWSIFINKRYDHTLIPKGQYCYAPNIEKNRDREGGDPYYIHPCPYYKTLGKEYNGCTYLGIMTNDLCFHDQCKICGEHYIDEFF